MTTPAGATGPFAASLIGSWELFHREDRSETGAVVPEPGLGEDPIGLLVYDRGGRFSAQFMKRDRSEGGPAAAEPASSGHNNTRATHGYDAYFGRYTVDEETHMVTQTLEGALSWENVGIVVTRHMEVDGDQLTLRLPTTSAGGEPVLRTLMWRRVAR